MDNTDKTCPVKLLAGSGAGKCDGEGCAWFCTDSKLCAVVSIANAGIDLATLAGPNSHGIGVHI